MPIRIGRSELIWVVGALFCVLAVFAATRLPIFRRSDPAALLLEAQQEFKAGHYERASALLGRLEQLRKPVPMDRIARAEVASAQRRFNEALDELARVPTDHELAPIANLLAGRIEVRQGRLPAAERHFRLTLDQDADNIQAYRELAYIFNVQRRLPEMDAVMEALSERNALSFPQLVHWVKTRNSTWDPSEDRVALERFVKAEPSDRHSRLALADALIQLGEPDQATHVLSALSDSDPDAAARRADIAIRKGHPDEAERILQKAPVDDPALARVRGTMALSTRHPSEAVGHFRKALERFPDDRAVLFGLGTALRSSGDSAAAQPYLEAARRFDAITPLVSLAAGRGGEQDPTLPLRIAEACEAAGRLPEARAWYRLVIAREPTHTVAQQHLFRLSPPQSKTPETVRPG
jgi:tetratricopeptide (TPR) repeat protein